tara:strand:- start:13667 stop:14617 length:951 start_codon:yes stop_codon:yes gene_type:complete
MQLTTNTRAFIEAEQYSSFILLNLHDGLLPDTFYRNVTDFSSGDTLHIKTVGSVTLQEASEDTPLVYNPIETGEITMAITDYVGDAWYVTDDLREDGNQIDTLMGERSAESTRAIQENFETRFLETAQSSQTDANANLINGFAHRISSTVATSGSENSFALTQLIQLRLAFDKANVPGEGRVFICDPVVEATLNGLVTITHDVTPFGQKILEQGMARGQRFIMSLYGFDIIQSNRLPTGTFSDGTTSISSAVANIAMCVLDDQTKPVMAAWRRMPKSEGERNKDRARDEFVVRAKYGFGTQRLDTLGVIITSAVNV